MLTVLASIQAIIFWLSLVAATLSLVVNGVFVYTEKTSAKRGHYGLVSLLSVLYIASYCLYLSGVWTRLEWSQVMVVPSLASWVLLWISPPLLDKLLHKANREVTK